MSAVLEVPLAEGGSILVEVDEPHDSPAVRGHPAASLPPLAESLEGVLARLGPVARALVSQVRELTDSPQEIEIEFAVKLSADARIVVARAGGEANFRILLKWRRPPDVLPPSGGDDR